MLTSEATKYKNKCNTSLESEDGTKLIPLQELFSLAKFVRDQVETYGFYRDDSRKFSGVKYEKNYESVGYQTYSDGAVFLTLFDSDANKHVTARVSAGVSGQTLELEIDKL